MEKDFTNKIKKAILLFVNDAKRIYIEQDLPLFQQQQKIDFLTSILIPEQSTLIKSTNANTENQSSQQLSQQIKQKNKKWNPFTIAKDAGYINMCKIIERLIDESIEQNRLMSVNQIQCKGRQLFSDKGFKASRAWAQKLLKNRLQFKGKQQMNEEKQQSISMQKIKQKFKQQFPSLPQIQMDRMLLRLDPNQGSVTLKRVKEQFANITQEQKETQKLL